MNAFAKAAQALPGRWHKGEYGDGKGNFCAAGHILLAFGANEEDVINGDGEDVTTDYTFTFLSELVQEFTNGNFTWVAEFNDDENTSESDVVALLEKAAVRWDERV